MNELEDLGLLEQPHAAAGRVPTDRGYRLFVDALAAPAPPTPDEQETIDRALAASARDVEQILTQVSRVLAELSTQVGFALAPSLDDVELSGLELVPLAERRALLVLALGEARVRPVTVEVESPLGRDELARVASLLRERLLGHTLREARRRLAGDEALVKDGAVALVIAAVQTAIVLAARPGVFVGGTVHAARHPEFREAQSLRPLLDLIDRSEPWRDLVHGEEPGLAVTIGREHGRPEWAHLSLVSFRLPGPGDASIGLLGPAAHGLRPRDGAGRLRGTASAVLRSEPTFPPSRSRLEAFASVARGRARPAGFVRRPASRRRARPTRRPSTRATARRRASRRPTCRRPIRPRSASPRSRPRSRGRKDARLRTEADLQNVRRRHLRELDDAERAGAERMVAPVLSLVDDLDRALEAAVGRGRGRERAGAGRRAGAPAPARHARRPRPGRRSRPLGEPFDPHAHEALLACAARDACRPGTSSQVIARGFRQGERVLRAARVVVSSGAPGKD